MSAEDVTVGGGNFVSDDPRINTLLESPLMQQVEIIGMREGGIIDCWVPSELIDHEEVPVKEEWARSLADEMREIAESKGGTGQLSPVILGYIEGENSFKIMDGFHRDAALKINGEERAYAAIQLTDWDGLYDVRIFTAKDHAHVRFSRVVQWIREVWSFSGIADKMSLQQAIILYRFETDGSKLGLDPADVETAKVWIARKEKQWDMAAMTIHSHLQVAETVDPRLIHAAREKNKSDALEAPTQAILKLFADQIPNNFDLQNLIMEHAMAHNLTAPQVRALCERVDGQGLENAQSSIASIDWDDLKPSHGRTHQRTLRRAHDVRFKGAGVFARAGWEIQNVMRRAKLSVERGEEIDPAMAERIRQASERIKVIMSDLGKTAVTLDQLLDQESSMDEATAPDAEAPTETIAAEDSDGLRQDIIGFLTGEGDMSAVRPFNQKQLTECFREIDRRKSKPEGWRDRFAEVQQAQLAGRLR